jgi:hypothetical protein
MDFEMVEIGKVSKWAPPTPPSPAMAMRALRNVDCSCSVTQPRLRENAAG